MHLCDPQLLHETPDAIVEYCKGCKKKIITKKDKKGRIDNKTYLKAHKRDVLQPKGKDAKLFEKVYGRFEDPVQKTNEALSKAKEEADAQMEKDLANIKRQEMSTGKLFF